MESLSPVFLWFTGWRSLPERSPGWFDLIDTPPSLSGEPRLKRLLLEAGFSLLLIISFWFLVLIFLSWFYNIFTWFFFTSLVLHLRTHEAKALFGKIIFILYKPMVGITKKPIFGIFCLSFFPYTVESNSD
jgi:hypothetical protein